MAEALSRLVPDSDWRPILGIRQRQVLVLVRAPPVYAVRAPSWTSVPKRFSAKLRPVFSVCESGVKELDNCNKTREILMPSAKIHFRPPEIIFQHCPDKLPGTTIRRCGH